MAIATSEPVKRRSIDPLYLIIGSGGMALLTNRAPALAIGATVLTLMLGLWAWLMKGKILAISAGPLRILLGLYLYFVLSYFLSNQPPSGLLTYDFIKHDGNFFFAYAMFFAFGSASLDYRTLFLLYHKVLLAVFSCLALLGLVEHVTHITHLVTRIDGGQPLFVAFNKAHNATGSVYAAACVAALAFVLFSDRARTRRYLPILVLCVLGLLLTRSRGSLLAFAVASVFLYRIRYSSWRAVLGRVLVLGIFTTAAVIWTGAQTRVVKAMNPEDDTNIVVRFVLWRGAGMLISNSPLTGVGFGRFNDLWNESQFASTPKLHGLSGIAAMSTDTKQVSDDSTAHNSYLQFLAETGVIGLGLLLAFWFSIFGRLRKGFRAAKDPIVRAASAAGMANIVLLLVLSLTENYLSATTVMLFMSVSVASALGLVGQSALLRRSDER